MVVHIHMICEMKSGACIVLHFRTNCRVSECGAPYVYNHTGVLIIP